VHAVGCPNGCSGNGRCVLISDVNTTVAYDSTAWDAGRIETCDCDPGFFGPDCSQRECLIPLFLLHPCTPPTPTHPQAAAPRAMIP